VLTLRETSYALFGAWRLAHFDRQGTAYFDRTREGALRSFWAAAILLPAYAILVMLHLSRLPVAIGWPGLILLYALQYAVAWTAFPAAMAFVAGVLDREEEFFGWLAMYNWSQVVAMIVVLPMQAILVSGIFDHPVLPLVGVLVDLAVLAYAWFIARAGLRIGGFAALGVVLIDVVLSEIIWEIGNLVATGRLANLRLS
jgi:hypothetical protein